MSLDMAREINQEFNLEFGPVPCGSCVGGLVENLPAR